MISKHDTFPPGTIGRRRALLSPRLVKPKKAYDAIIVVGGHGLATAPDIVHAAFQIPNLNFKSLIVNC